MLSLSKIRAPIEAGSRCALGGWCFGAHFEIFPVISEEWDTCHIACSPKRNMSVALPFSPLVMPITNSTSVLGGWGKKKISIWMNFILFSFIFYNFFSQYFIIIKKPFSWSNPWPTLGVHTTTNIKLSRTLTRWQELNHATPVHLLSWLWASFLKKSVQHHYFNGLEVPSGYRAGQQYCYNSKVIFLPINF